MSGQQTREASDRLTCMQWLPEQDAPQIVGVVQGEGADSRWPL